MKKQYDMTKELLQSMIGKTKEEAKNLANFNGYAIRVRQEDENAYIGTSDYKLDRINLELKDEIVTKASIG